MRVKPHLFYGWWIVVAGFLIVAYGMGASEYMSSQLPDLLKEFGGSAITMGIALSVTSPYRWYCFVSNRASH